MRENLRVATEIETKFGTRRRHQNRWPCFDRASGSRPVVAGQLILPPLPSNEVDCPLIVPHSELTSPHVNLNPKYLNHGLYPPPSASLSPCYPVQPSPYLSQTPALPLVSLLEATCPQIPTRHVANLPALSSFLRKRFCQQSQSSLSCLTAPPMDPPLIPCPCPSSDDMSTVV